MAVLTIHKYLRAVAWRQGEGKTSRYGKPALSRHGNGRFYALNPKVSNIGCIQSDCYTWRGTRYFPEYFWFRRNCQHPSAGDGTTLFVTLWEFEVKPGSEKLFEQIYGPEGEWARLFRQDVRYRGTRLLRDAGAERAYVTIDEWESRTAYEEFREKFAAEYAELDRKCEGMTVVESHLGYHQS